MSYNLTSSSSDDENIIEKLNKRERKFKQRINYILIMLYFFALFTTNNFY